MCIQLNEPRWHGIQWIERLVVATTVEPKGVGKAFAQGAIAFVCLDTLLNPLLYDEQRLPREGMFIEIEFQR
jgi:hypothetical protein